MPVIRKRPRALDDLSEIWNYIADDSVAQADILSTALTRNSERWRHNP